MAAQIVAGNYGFLFLFWLKVLSPCIYGEVFFHITSWFTYGQDQGKYFDVFILQPLTGGVSQITDPKRQLRLIIWREGFYYWILAKIQHNMGHLVYFNCHFSSGSKKWILSVSFDPTSLESIKSKLWQFQVLIHFNLVSFTILLSLSFFLYIHNSCQFILLWDFLMESFLSVSLGDLIPHFVLQININNFFS